MDHHPLAGARAGVQKQQAGRKNVSQVSQWEQVNKIAQAREERRRISELEAKRNREERQKFSCTGDQEINQYQMMISAERAKAIQAGAGAAAKPPNPAAKVAVFVRKRPLSKKEVKAKAFDVITSVQGGSGDTGKQEGNAWGSWSGGKCIVHEPRRRVDLAKCIDNYSFNFDLVFPEDRDNHDVYQQAVEPLLHRMGQHKGTSATVFAYGQTGSGKTYTVSSFYAKAGAAMLEIASSRGLSLQVRFFEIYGGKCFDLLAGRKRFHPLEYKGEVYLKGVTERRAGSLDDILHLVDEGQACRSTGSTSANQASSRSHSLFEMLFVRGENVEGKLALVDLAGSERGADRGNVDSKTRQEGAEINKSLLALKECIRALHTQQGRGSRDTEKHVPFRGSRLTHIMRDAFIGQHSHTVLLACVSPSSESTEHSLNTLRYAVRLKESKAVNTNVVTSAPPPVAPARPLHPPKQQGKVDRERENRVNSSSASSSSGQAKPGGRPKLIVPADDDEHMPVVDEEDPPQPPTPVRLLAEGPAMSNLLGKPGRRAAEEKKKKAVKKQPRAKKRPEWNSDFVSEDPAEKQEAFESRMKLQHTFNQVAGAPYNPRAVPDPAGEYWSAAVERGLDEPPPSRHSEGRVQDLDDASQDWDHPEPPRAAPPQGHHYSNMQKDILQRVNSDQWRSNQPKVPAPPAQGGPNRRRDNVTARAHQRGQSSEEESAAEEDDDGALAIPDDEYEYLMRGRDAINPQMLQTRELAAIDNHGAAKRHRMQAERAMMQAHTSIAQDLAELEVQEAAFIKKSSAQSGAGDLDVEAYTAQLEDMLDRRAELDSKLRAKLMELRAHAKAEMNAELQLEDIFWDKGSDQD